MGASHSKVSCMWLPAQSGKCRKMTELIEAYRDMKMVVGNSKWEETNEESKRNNEDDEDDNFFNVIVCSNNVLLVGQTQKRMTDDLYSTSFVLHDDDKKEVVSTSDDNCDVYAWTSKDVRSRSVRDIAYSITHNELKMLVCCAHSTRLEKYLKALIETLSSDFTKKIFHKKINIWIDEADASINLWSKYENLLKLDVVNKVTLVSATYESIIKRYKKISVIPFEKTHPECYVGIKDADHNICNIEKKTAYGYIKSVVKELDLIEDMKPGYCLFAPGDVSIDSHKMIKDFFFKNGCAVAVLNGQKKKIYIPGETAIDIKEELSLQKPEEIGKIIAKKYIDLNIKERFPFVVTGQLCLGRGLTFQSKDFLFTASIISYMRNKASLYQCATRIAGNIKHYQTEKHRMYCTEKTKKILLEMESCAVNVAKILCDTNSTEVDKHVIREAKNVDNEDNGKYNGLKKYVQVQILEFPVSDENDSKQIWRDVRNKYEEHVGKKLNSKSMLKLNDDGFYECSLTDETGVQDTNIKNIIRGWRWYSNFQVTKNRYNYARLYAGYNDKTDNTKYTIILRTLTIKNNDETTELLSKFNK